MNKGAKIALAFCGWGTAAYGADTQPKSDWYVVAMDRSHMSLFDSNIIKSGMTGAFALILEVSPHPESGVSPVVMAKFEFDCATKKTRAASHVGMSEDLKQSTPLVLDTGEWIPIPKSSMMDQAMTVACGTKADIPKDWIEGGEDALRLINFYREKFLNGSP